MTPITGAVLTLTVWTACSSTVAGADTSDPLQVAAIIVDAVSPGLDGPTAQMAKDAIFALYNRQQDPVSSTCPVMRSLVLAVACAPVLHEGLHPFHAYDSVEVLLHHHIHQRLWLDLANADERLLRQMIFYQRIARRIADLRREIDVIAKRKPAKIIPPKLPSSITGGFNGFPDPSVVADPSERTAYAAELQRFNHELLDDRLLSYLPGVLSRYETNLARCLLRLGPHGSLASVTDFTAVMQVAGVEDERVQRLFMSEQPMENTP